MARKSKQEHSDDAILREARARHKAAAEAESDQRKLMLDDMKFASGDQWPEAVKNQRESPHQQGGPRPCLVINKLAQYKHQVLNDIRQNSPSIRVRPVDSGSDPEVAEVIQGLIRHIEDGCSADIAYDTAADSAVTSGLGYFRVCTEWSSPDAWSQDITIKRVANPFSVFLDHNSKEPDGSDAEWALIVDMMPEEEFRAQYPDEDPKSWDVESIGDDKHVWFEGSGESRSILVAEYFRKVSVPDRVLLLSDGTVCLASSLGGKVPPSGISIVKERATTTKKVEWYKLTACKVLARSEFPASYIPIIPVIGEELWVGPKRILQGLIRPAKDAARMYNYMRSAAVERIALTPKAPYVAGEGQLEGYETEWERANVDNVAVLTYKPQVIEGQLLPAPQRQQAPDVPMGFVEEANRAEMDIQTTLGIYNAGIGAPSNEKSGKAIFLRQREADVATFHFVDNLSRSIRHAGKIIVELIPKIYDTKRVARILGDDGKTQSVEFDPDQPEAVMGRVDPRTGEITKIYNPGLGKYDVTVSAGPSYTTKRQEAADAQMAIIQANPQLFPIIGDIMVRNMDWPGADEIADRLQKMLPPNLQKKADGEQDNGMAQQMQQLMAAAETKIQELSQQIEALQNDRALKVAELELQEKDINAGLEKARLESATKLEVERMRGSQDAIQAILSELSDLKQAGALTADALEHLHERLNGLDAEEDDAEEGPEPPETDESKEPA